MTKKVVEYIKGTLEYPARLIPWFTNHAMLVPINHPDSALVSNTKHVLTSEVVSYDPPSGRLETLNTIYLPKLKELL